MIPIKDENPTFSTPVITIALIVINIIVFFTEPVLGSGSSIERQIKQARYFACNGAIPYELTHGDRVADARRGGFQFEKPLDVAFAELEAQSCPNKSVWLSILKSMFLHG